MDDLKLMTVRALRELAKTHLGSGYSKLKTKAELISALAKKLADDAKAAQAKAKPAKADGKAPARPEPKKAAPKPEAPGVVPKVEAPKVEPKPEAKAAPKVEAPKVEPRPESKKPVRSGDTQKLEAVPPPKPSRGGDTQKLEAVPEPGKIEPGTPARARKPGQKPVDLAALRMGASEPESEELATELDEEAVEASLVPPATAKALVEPTPTPRKKSQAEIDLENEHLGELPWGYGADAVVLVARDPHTLWVYWDFAEQTARRAREGLAHPRAVLRLFDGGQVVREVDVALEARSWYLNHVTPGRRYRAELQFVGERGQAKRIGPTSNNAPVPTEGPSPVIDDRFVTVPWDVPLAKSAAILEHPKPGRPFPERNRDALLAMAEESLHQEILHAAGPGQVEVTVEVVRGLGGSETLVHRSRRRERFGGPTSSRAADWNSSRHR